VVVGALFWFLLLLAWALYVLGPMPRWT